MLWVFSHDLAYAQTPESETVKAKQVEQVIDVAEPLQNDSVSDVINSALDLDDPALIEALEAREKANRAIAEAVAAQKEEQAANQEKGLDISPKKSIFPASADEAKALLKTILDKIIGWLSSISFLAQLGAIALAYMLSPLIAGRLRKKVVLFNHCLLYTSPSPRD